MNIQVALAVLTGACKSHLERAQFKSEKATITATLDFLSRVQRLQLSEETFWVLIRRLQSDIAHLRASYAISAKACAAYERFLQECHLLGQYALGIEQHDTLSSKAEVFSMGFDCSEPESELDQAYKAFVAQVKETILELEDVCLRLQRADAVFDTARVSLPCLDAEDSFPFDLSWNMVRQSLSKAYRCIDAALQILHTQDERLTTQSQLTSSLEEPVAGEQNGPLKE